MDQAISLPLEVFATVNKHFNQPTEIESSSLISIVDNEVKLYIFYSIFSRGIFKERVYSKRKKDILINTLLH